MKDMRECLNVHMLGHSAGLPFSALVELGKNVAASMSYSTKSFHPPTARLASVLSNVKPPLNRWWINNPHLPESASAAPTCHHADAAPACCPQRKGVYMKHLHKPLARVLYPDCKRLSCPYCGTKKREIWIGQVKAHLFDQARIADQVFLFWCHRSRWKAISRYINDHGGEHFRLNPQGGDTFLICSNFYPGRHVDQKVLEPMTCSQAVDRLSHTIAALPKLDIKMFTSSRGWQTKTNKKQSSWERVGKVASSIDTVRDILEQRCAGELTTVFSHQAEPWQWCAVQWRRGTMTASDQHVQFEIECGDLMPDWNPFDKSDSAKSECSGGTVPSSVGSFLLFGEVREVDTGPLQPAFR